MKKLEEMEAEIMEEVRTLSGAVLVLVGEGGGFYGFRKQQEVVGDGLRLWSR